MLVPSSAFVSQPFHYSYPIDSRPPTSSVKPLPIISHIPRTRVVLESIVLSLGMLDPFLKLSIISLQIHQSQKFFVASNMVTLGLSLGKCNSSAQLRYIKYNYLLNYGRKATYFDVNCSHSKLALSIYQLFLWINTRLSAKSGRYRSIQKKSLYPCSLSICTWEKLITWSHGSELLLPFFVHCGVLLRRRLGSLQGREDVGGADWFHIIVIQSSLSRFQLCQ